MLLLTTLRRWLLKGSLLLALPAAAQTLDPTFQPVDIRTPSISRSASGTAIARDGQGRVVVGGRFEFVAGQPAGNVARLLPDGTVDPSFNPGGTGANGPVYHVAALADGRWLIAGEFTHYNDQPTHHVARLLPDGALDTTFLVGDGLDARVEFLALDSRQRVVLGGNFHRYDGEPVTGVIRLLPTGRLDPTFQPAIDLGGGAPYALAVDATDRVLVARYDALRVSTLERLLPTGALDTTFAAGGGRLSGGWIHLFKVLRNGQIMLMHYGGTATLGGVDLTNVARLNADGTLDRSFTCNVEGFTLRTIEETSAGLLLGGNDLYTGAFSTPVSLRRLRADGSNDSTFVGPKLTDVYHSGGVRAIAADPSGQLVVAGDFERLWSHATVGFGRLTPTGAADPTFTVAALDVRGYVTGLHRQSGDRLLVAGYFHFINGQPARGLARLLADGTSDPSFQPDASIFQSNAYPGPLLVDGADRVIAVLQNQFPARYLPNGEFDSSFPVTPGPGGGSRTGQGLHVVLYPDSRLLVGGDFTSYHGQARPGLARLLAADGALDPSFVPPASMAGQRVVRVVLLPDGSVGVMTMAIPPNPQIPPGPPSADHGSLYWLDATGQPLPAINGGQPLPDSVVTELVAALPDTTLLVRTQIWTSSGRVWALQKLTRTGAYDPTFAPDTAMLAHPFQVLPQPDGQLLVLGTFSDQPGGSLRRLTATGAFDPTFRLPAFDVTGLAAAVFQSDNRLVVGGGFATVDGQPRPSVVRFADVVTGRSAPLAARAAVLDVFPNPVHGALTVRRPAPLPATATLLDVLGRPVRRWPLTAADTRLPLAGVPAGTYVLRVVSADAVATRRVVVE